MQLATVYRIANPVSCGQLKKRPNGCGVGDLFQHLLTGNYMVVNPHCGQLNRENQFSLSSLSAYRRSFSRVSFGCPVRPQLRDSVPPSRLPPRFPSDRNVMCHRLSPEFITTSRNCLYYCQYRHLRLVSCR